MLEGDASDWRDAADLSPAGTQVRGPLSSVSVTLFARPPFQNPRDIDIVSLRR